MKSPGLYDIIKHCSESQRLSKATANVQFASALQTFLHVPLQSLFYSIAVDDCMSEQESVEGMLHYYFW